MLQSLKRDLQLRIAALLPGSDLVRLQRSCREFNAEFIREAVVLAAHHIGRRLPVRMSSGTWAQWRDVGENRLSCGFAIVSAVTPASGGS